MTNYRNSLPQMNRPCITSGGLETTFIFKMGIDLPAFSSLSLLSRADGRQLIEDYFTPFIGIARSRGYGIVLDTPTWRASPDWAGPLGFAGRDSLAEANRSALAAMADLRARHDSSESPVVIQGCIGPRGDGYDPGRLMSVEEARDYHGWQMRLIAESEADLAGAMTMNNVAEASGIALAARDCDVPVAISFTLETDGRLPTGQGLREAIEETDEASDGWPAYYLINCAHPSHFSRMLETETGEWQGRLRGVMANASRRSHAELDCACDLDDGNPAELGREIAGVLATLPHLTILGGCCGTDDRHIAEIAAACRISRAA